MAEHDWPSFDVKDHEWSDENGAGRAPFRVRMCPDCCALVLDADEAQQRHKTSHGLSAMGLM